jgi:type II secretory pathway pseudopilin PulG
MQTKKRRKKFMTLIEIMIVMFLITLIAGAVTYKVKDAMDYGKAFKTHQGVKQIKEILELSVAKHPRKINQIEREWEDYVARSPLTGNTEALKTDGWGESYRVSIKRNHRGKIVIEVTSERFEEYKESHDTLFEE